MSSAANLVIDHRSQPVTSAWTLLAEDASIPEAGQVIISRARLPETERGGLGVLLAPADPVESLAGALDRIDLVAISFPKFRDGRGFTQARILRERYSYRGDIRAVGHVLPDQFMALLRCGVSSVELAEGQDPAIWAEVLALRGGLDDRPMSQRPLPLLRRLAAPLSV